MKNKHPNAIVVLVLGFAMAGLHLADLLLWSDAETGFATAGSVWLRYIPWLAALVLPYLPARRAANQPTGLQDTCPPLGLCMVLAGAALVTSGVAMGPVAKYAVQYPEMFSTDYPTWLFAGTVPLYFLWKLIWRFQFTPASVYRMPCALRVLSAAAALLFAVVLIKVFLVPGLPCGHTLYAAGTGAYLLCTGLELTQTLFEAIC